MKKFDRHLGKQLHATLPSTPGVYRFYNEAKELIYIGKAKNLKRRLSQYRNAKRCRAHAKMRKIVSEARSLDYDLCSTELEALTLENQLIQQHRPKWNVAGAFFFLYPMVGLSLRDGILYLCYTTTPELYSEFSFHGAFRSRDRTRTAFFSLTELLRLIGHSIAKPSLLKSLKLPAPQKYTYLYGYRQVPENWMNSLCAFLNGGDFSPLGELSLLLLDKPDAIKRADEIQEHLRNLRQFWKREILPLKKAREHSKSNEYPVLQRDRDQLFIQLLSGSPLVQKS
jgi:predicted GIY-YIG superfamily endonuclease